MKRYRKLLLSLSLLMLVITGIFVYALLTDKDTKGSIKYQIGDLEYVVEGDILDNYIYPGINLVTESYTLTNNSTIATELRIKLRFYLGDTWYNLEDFLIFIEEDGFDFNNENWTASGGYLYFNETLTGEENITLFTKLILDGHVVKNQFESKDFKIELTIHAKQKDNVDWESLGSKLIN